MNAGELKKFLEQISDDTIVCVGPPWSDYTAEEISDCCLMEGKYKKDGAPKMTLHEVNGVYLFLGWPGNYDSDSNIQQSKILKTLYN